MAKAFNTSPFVIMEQDCDDVIMFINYYLKKAENEPAAETSPANNGQQKIKVNDRTATGGWW